MRYHYEIVTVRCIELGHYIPETTAMTKNGTQLDLLRQHVKSNETPIKPEPRFELTAEEVDNLLSQVILPTLHKIAEELKPYFKIKVHGFKRTARIRIYERNSHFTFQVNIHNFRLGSIDLTATSHTGSFLFSSRTDLEILKEQLALRNHKLLTEESIIGTFTRIFATRNAVTKKIARKTAKFDELYPIEYFERLEAEAFNSTDISDLNLKSNGFRGIFG